MKGKSNWGFYGVKIIKQILVSGEPDPIYIDEYYNDDQYFEESIMIIRAQSFEHACKIAKKKATEDEEPYENIYGQKVVWKFIGTVDCFEIWDEIKSGAEVYSCFHSANKNETASEFINKRFTPADGCRKARRR